MAEAVYTLCFLTTALVAFLLLRAYRRTGQRMPLWCGVGFVWLCLNNLMLIVDFVMFPETDLAIARAIPALVGISLIVFGLIWESTGAQRGRS